MEGEALDAVLERRDVEVDEGSDLPTAEPKVRQPLGLVYGLEAPNGLERDDYRVVDQNVEPMCAPAGRDGSHATVALTGRGRAGVISFEVTQLSQNRRQVDGGQALRGWKEIK